MNNTWIKRKICLLLAVCMLFSVLIPGALATSQGDSGLPFTDVSPTAWYHSAVRFVYQRDIMQGISPTMFEPNRSVSRAMVAATLFRAYHGRPAGAADSRENPFHDVPANAWFAPYVSWAYSHGIADGIGGGRFAPHNVVTREQFATMLHRYADPDYFVRVTTVFPDFGEWSDWATEAIHWAISHGILRGTSGGLLNARGTMSRAECAMMLMRFLPVDISSLLGSWFDDVEHLLGNPVGGATIDGVVYRDFDTSLTVAVTEPETHSGMIILVQIAYGWINDQERFHFQGINGLSTTYDVRTLFDRQPDSVIPWGEDYPDKIFSYVYSLFEGAAWVQFLFDLDGTVTVITLQSTGGIQ